MAHVNMLESECEASRLTTGPAHLLTVVLILYGAILISALAALAAHAVESAVDKALQVYDRNFKPQKMPKGFFRVSIIEMKRMYTVEFWFAVAVLGIFALCVVPNPFGPAHCGPLMDATLTYGLSLVEKCLGTMLRKVEEIPEMRVRVAQRLNALGEEMEVESEGRLARDEQQTGFATSSRRARPATLSNVPDTTSSYHDGCNESTVSQAEGAEFRAVKPDEEDVKERSQQEDKKDITSVWGRVEILKREAEDASSTQRHTVRAQLSTDARLRLQNHHKLMALRSELGLQLKDAVRHVRNFRSKQEDSVEESGTIEVQSQHIDPDGEARDLGWEVVEEGPEDENWDWLPRRA
ncbi:uncharacterized protein CLAFUR5_06868 [Fulvia fulva]|uniref:Uncharacterized protein n=1 Tax=Passalora fulva TaxID=5499 RepID=A0A9Q8UQR3_PASFU|nr:uncharacterized protein CLAFUR5_06868 [Fulvia fulva]KAK4622601.1 hypothetical protein CLAFUR0_06728 [Fulvia fulva]UJO18983.1 hypothetical protein CLAFUR5_06868 [Fulvia fulva]